MPSHERSAAATLQVTPESAESFRQQLAAARDAAGRSAAAFAAACADSTLGLPSLSRSASAVLEDAARLQGLASLVARLP